MVKHKVYTVGGSISSKKLHQLLGGKKITLKGKGDTDVNFHFKKLKDYNKYVKNLQSGKGQRINLDSLHDLTDHQGGSFLGSLKRIGRKIKNVGEKAVKTVAPIAKPIIKAGLPLAKQYAQQAVMEGVTAYTGNPVAGVIAGKLAGDATQAAGNKVVGSGFFDVAKKISKKVAPIVAKEGVKKLTGNSDLANIASTATKMTVGKGLVEAMENDGLGLGGNRLLKSTMLQTPDIYRKMEMVRSHRKKKVGKGVLPY